MDRAAREILRAVERNTAIAPVTPEAKVGLLASRLTPGLLRALIFDWAKLPTH